MSEPNPPGQPTPPVPPAPPAPPVPPVPPVPKYGEYAPAGYVPPSQVPDRIAPGYEQQAPAGYAQPLGAGPARRVRKTWDLVLTVVLLVVGLFGMGFGLLYAAIFSDPTLLDQTLQQQGQGGFNGSVGAAPAILAISHVVLYLIALGGALPLLLTRRIAFWVPLAAGVLAAIIFWVTVMGVLLSDPNLATFS